MAYEAELEKIISRMRTHGSGGQGLKKVEDAFKYAAERLAGKKTESGKPVFAHNTMVANTLLDVRADSDAVAAGLLHNLTDYGMTPKEIEGEFGSGIANLVESRDRLEALVRKELEQGSKERAEELLLMMASDVSLVLLALADKLSMMRLYKDIGSEHAKGELEAAKEIYVPLAERMGVFKIKNELEDLAMQHSMPDEYNELTVKLDSRKSEREHRLEKVRGMLRRKLAEAGIEAEVEGRTKHVASIYSKMKRLGKSFEEIYDLSAVRVITSSVDDCYKALGIVHANWRPLPGQFDDYIAKPKSNRYQSLHTAVIGPDNRVIEVQIRTREMHNAAEYGAAAHWQYKGARSFPKHDKRIRILKQLMQWSSAPKAGSLGESLKLDVGGEIFVLTPKREVIELPSGATVLDFAYAVHTDIGARCRAARVNGKAAPINRSLSNGDMVEIITSPKQQPRRAWLAIAKSEKAISKIRHALAIHWGRITKPKKLGGCAVKSTDKRVRLANCCLPAKGDDIVGVVTTKRKISVHRRNCAELLKVANSRLVEVAWEGRQRIYNVGIRVTGNDRVGLLSDIIREISGRGINIKSAGAKIPAINIANCFFELEAVNGEQLDSIMERLRKINGVSRVLRE